MVDAKIQNDLEQITLVSMNTLHIGIDTAFEDSTNSEVAFRRHHRARNLITTKNTAANQPLRSDVARFDETFKSSIRKGLVAARQNTFPALFTLGLMGLLGWAFYSIPAVNAFFNSVSAFKIKTGMAFAFIGSGVCIGLLSEVLTIPTQAKKRWTMENTKSFFFLFFVFGIMAAAKDPVYLLLANLYGEGNSTSVLIKKTVFDQFVWTVFLACPYQTLLFAWKNNGYSADKVKAECPNFSEFFAVKMMPVLISNWAFWIPMSVIIFSFPTDLQLAVSIIAISLWVCILNMLTRTKAN